MYDGKCVHSISNVPLLWAAAVGGGVMLHLNAPQNGEARAMLSDCIQEVPGLRCSPVGNETQFSSPLRVTVLKRHCEFSSSVVCWVTLFLTVYIYIFGDGGTQCI